VQCTGDGSPGVCGLIGKQTCGTADNGGIWSKDDSSACFSTGAGPDCCVGAPLVDRRPSDDVPFCLGKAGVDSDQPTYPGLCADPLKYECQNSVFQPFGCSHVAPGTQCCTESITGDGGDATLIKIVPADYYMAPCTSDSGGSGSRIDFNMDCVGGSIISGEEKPLICNGRMSTIKKGTRIRCCIGPPRFDVNSSVLHVVAKRWPNVMKSIKIYEDYNRQTVS